MRTRLKKMEAPRSPVKVCGEASLLSGSLTRPCGEAQYTDLLEPSQQPNKAKRKGPNFSCTSFYTWRAQVVVPSPAWTFWHPRSCFKPKPKEDRDGSPKDNPRL